MNERIILSILDMFEPGMARRRLLQVGLLVAVVLHVWVWAVAGADTVRRRRAGRHTSRAHDVGQAMRAAEGRVRARRFDAAAEMLAHWRSVVSQVMGEAAATQPRPAAAADPAVDALADRFAGRR